MLYNISKYFFINIWYGFIINTFQYETDLISEKGYLYTRHRSWFSLYNRLSEERIPIITDNENKSSLLGIKESVTMETKILGVKNVKIDLFTGS